MSYKVTVTVQHFRHKERVSRYMTVKGDSEQSILDRIYACLEHAEFFNPKIATPETAETCWTCDKPASQTFDFGPLGGGFICNECFTSLIEGNTHTHLVADALRRKAAEWVKKAASEDKKRRNLG